MIDFIHLFNLNSILFLLVFRLKVHLYYASTNLFIGLWILFNFRYRSILLYISFYFLLIIIRCWIWNKQETIKGNLRDIIFYVSIYICLLQDLIKKFVGKYYSLLSDFISELLLYLLLLNLSILLLNIIKCELICDYIFLFYPDFLLYIMGLNNNKYIWARFLSKCKFI